MSEAATQGLFATAIANAKAEGLSVGESDNTESTTLSSETTADIDISDLSNNEENSGNLQEESDSIQEDSADSDQEAQSDETSNENIEYIQVTDHHNRRRQLKIDYSDKDSIKKAFSMAVGARKWQVERDALHKELSAYKEGSGQKVENWDTISSVYEKEGIPGLVNFLEGSDSAFNKLIDESIERRNWSPEQVQQYEAHQAQVLKNKEVEKLRQELEELKNSQLSAKEEAELSTLKAEINPVFDKYRFAGKLGNPAHEEMLDEMLWNNAMKQLEILPDDADINSALVNKVFRNYANNLRTLVKQEAERKVSKVVENKKRQATENAQLKTSKSLEHNQDKVTARDLIKEGRIGDLFRAAASRNKNFIS